MSLLAQLNAQKAAKSTAKKDKAPAKVWICDGVAIEGGKTLASLSANGEPAKVFEVYGFTAAIIRYLAGKRAPATPKGKAATAVVVAPPSVEDVQL